MPQLQERNQVGKREDLANIIANVESESTPVVATLKKGDKATNMLFDWQADDFVEGDRDGVPDGKPVDVIKNQSENRALLYGRQQVFRETYGVGFIAENVSNVAGVGKKGELANSMMKALFVLRRTIEKQICSDDESRESTSATVGSKTRGLGKWLQNSAQTDLPVNANYRTPTESVYGGSFASFTEDSLKGILSSLFDKCKTRKRYVGVVGIGLKQKISDFGQFQAGVSSTVAAVRTFQQMATDKKLYAIVDFYSADGGDIELVPSAFIRPDSSKAIQQHSGFIIDPEMAELRYAELPSQTPLPEDGSGTSGFVRAIAGLVVSNPLAHGKIASTD